MLLPRPERERFSLALASCAFELADYTWADAAAVHAGSAGAALRRLTQLGLMIWEEENEAAFVAFTALARSSPALVRRLAASSIDDLTNDLSTENSLALYEALESAGWQGERVQDDARLRLAHARLLAERGRTSEARERLHDPLPAATVIAIRSDRRFDALREDAAFEQRLDVARAAERDLARVRAEIAARPQSIEAAIRSITALRALGRTAEAIREAERALALDEASDGAHYADRDARLNWLLNAYADALFEADRADDAQSALLRAIAHGENDEPNVSQALARALALSDEGRAAEALAELDHIEGTSGYERLWIEAIRVCAGQQLDDFRRRGRALAKLESDGEWSAARVRALLCIGDLDTAAAVYIARLQDPAAREEALRVLQRYANPPERALPQRALIRERQRALARRPDVAAAAMELGRIEDLPIAATDERDF
ncbi:MAG TPA: hypothetical protein VFT98_11835 [Myxococcota bacterium]|nr:hypothetical protein [Myxococcota bacterium]